MIIVELLRIEDTKENGTFGVLRIDKGLFCYTLEPSNHLNKRFISCIPEGQYSCKMNESSMHVNTFYVIDVPERSGIFFHAGNTIIDTRGCILLGSEIMMMGNSKRGVINSVNTLNRFKTVIGGESKFSLTITSHF